MIRIAIVEDDATEAERLQNYLKQYFTDCGGTDRYNANVFTSAVTFTDSYRADFELVFMDIDLPGINGMKAAEELRKKDPFVIIVFVTNLRQYAVKGYSVNALDFIVKPVTYVVFRTLMNRIIRKLSYQKEESVVINTASGLIKLPLNDIYYVEVSNHKLSYHTRDGEQSAWGTLKNLDSVLPAGQFVRCNSGYLVNLRYVKKIEDEFVYVGNERLPISRAKRKTFLAALTEYLHA